MKTRAIKNGNIVWFGSIGKNQDGTAKFYNENKKSFSENQQAVSDSLIQRLSVIKKELWYKMSYGLPLFEKVRSKAYIDSVVMDIITSHPDVTQIISFKSTDINKTYSCYAVIASVYGEIELNI